MKARINGIQINYEIEGSSGPWVTLSHSLACSLRMWDEQAELLRRRYRVLRFDTRGHGGSDAPAGAYTLDQLAEDLRGLLDVLGIQQTHFVGLSLGGMIGMTFVLNHPGVFKTLVLCDTSSRLARGFRAAGIRCGIKEQKRDLALLACDTLASAAGMFTTNAVRAAPVLISQERIQSGVARAIVINSGNANACTGPQGLRDAEEMAALTAHALGVAEEFVFVASTGVIGIPLPMEPIRSGIPAAVAELSTDGAAAAEAILTTDAFPKTAGVRLEIEGDLVTIGGMAKGAGMIHPQMATTLAFVTTDAVIPALLLRKALRAAVNASFNCISVDGDTSTNDSIFLLSSGAAGHRPIVEEDEQFVRFQSALTEVTTQLAKLIVRDGEGATKVVTLTMKGAASERDAKRAAQAAMTSPLVKTMLYGAEPNWGRLVAAVGRSGTPVAEDRVSVWIGGVQVVRNGMGISSNLPEAAEAMRASEFEIVIDLQQGSGRFTGWTSDLNDTYVKINAGYMT